MATDSRFRKQVNECEAIERLFSLNQGLTAALALLRQLALLVGFFPKWRFRNMASNPEWGERRQYSDEIHVTPRVWTERTIGSQTKLARKKPKLKPHCIMPTPRPRMRLQIPGSNNELAGTHGTINRAGWRRRSDPADPRSGWEYLILPGAWKSELCAGFNASTVARSLADYGLLLGDAGGKTSTTVTIPGQSKKIRVYRLSSDIIADQRGNEATKKGEGNA